MSVISCFAMFAVSFFGPLMDADTSVNDATIDVQADLETDLPSGKWLHSFEEAKARAIAEKLPLLLHFEATWCGPCRQMDTDVLNQPQVTQLLGSRVIGVRIDADRNAKLISEYGIKTLPTELLIQPDGTQGDLQPGALSLNSYVTRLERVSAGSVAEQEASIAAKEQEGFARSRETRSCLIIERDGKMVGLGGFSPVALAGARKWQKGSEEFVVNHEGVDYFLQSADEVELFRSDARRYIPRLHGCDLVELYSENRAKTGAIEYGAVYEGELFFFASVENRARFQQDPSWYLDVTADGAPVNADAFPFLQTSSFE